MEAPGAAPGPAEPSPKSKASGIPRRRSAGSPRTQGLKIHEPMIPSTATRLGLLSPPSMVTAKHRAAVPAARTPGQRRVVVGLVSRRPENQNCLRPPPPPFHIPLPLRARKDRDGFACPLFRGSPDICGTSLSHLSHPCCSRGPTPVTRLLGCALPPCKLRVLSGFPGLGILLPVKPISRRGVCLLSDLRRCCIARAGQVPDGHSLAHPATASGHAAHPPLSCHIQRPTHPKHVLATRQPRSSPQFHVPVAAASGSGKRAARISPPRVSPSRLYARSPPSASTSPDRSAATAAAGPRSTLRSSELASPPRPAAITGGASGGWDSGRDGRAAVTTSAVTDVLDRVVVVLLTWA